MTNRVDVSDLEINCRIRVAEDELATVKYLGEVSLLKILIHLIAPTTKKKRNASKTIFENYDYET